MNMSTRTNSPALLSEESPILPTKTLIGDKVRNPDGEDLGSIEELMIDFRRGRIAYAVLSFGGFAGLADKLFAIPWSALRIDGSEGHLVLDVPRDRLKDAPGFDKSQWPNMADLRWGGSIYEYYGQEPYWAIEHGPRPGEKL